MIIGPIHQEKHQFVCQTLLSEIYFTGNTWQQSKTVLKKRKSKESLHLKNEVQILTLMKGYVGFPRIYCGEKDQFNVPESIELQRLGKSLKNLISNSNAAQIRIPIAFIVNLSFQMLQRVQSLHQKGFLHNDLKPDHFLFETDEPTSCLYLIDFGLASRITHGKAQGSKQARTFRGNILYSSVNKMNCGKETVKDDLESLLYIIGELLEGELPWKPKALNKAQGRNLKDIFTSILAKKTRKHPWKNYGPWINQTLKKIREGQNPYSQLRKRICLLLQL